MLSRPYTALHMLYLGTAFPLSSPSSPIRPSRFNSGYHLLQEALHGSHVLPTPSLDSERFSYTTVAHNFTCIDHNASHTPLLLSVYCRSHWLYQLLEDRDCASLILLFIHASSAPRTVTGRKWPSVNICDMNAWVPSHNLWEPSSPLPPFTCFCIFTHRWLLSFYLYICSKLSHAKTKQNKKLKWAWWLPASFSAPGPCHHGTSGKAQPHWQSSRPHYPVPGLSGASRLCPHHFTGNALASVSVSPWFPRAYRCRLPRRREAILLLQPLHPGSPYTSLCSFLGLHWLLFLFPPLKSNCPQSSLLSHTRCCSFMFPSPVASAPPYKSMPFKSVSSSADPKIQLPVAHSPRCAADASKSVYPKLQFFCSPLQIHRALCPLTLRITANTGLEMQSPCRLILIPTHSIAPSGNVLVSTRQGVTSKNTMITTVTFI